MATYKTLGITDDVHCCDCCGKSNLKSTVAMERNDGEVLHFGSVCATKHTGRSIKVIRAEASAAAAAKQSVANAEFRATAAQKAYEEKLAEAHRLRIRPGRAFAEYVHATAQASHEAAVAIAMKHGVQRITV